MLIRDPDCLMWSRLRIINHWPTVFPGNCIYLTLVVHFLQSPKNEPKKDFFTCKAFREWSVFQSFLNATMDLRENCFS